ncbi:hypothetical protein ACPA0F_18565 [Solibacillus silvestris]
MKINAKGSVTFSVRNDDKDLYDLIAKLPEGGGSDMLRALLRDGLAYQQLVTDGTVSTSYFNMLCQLKRLDAEDLLQPFNDYSPNKTATDKKTTTSKKRTSKNTKKADEVTATTSETTAEETEKNDPPPTPDKPESQAEKDFNSSFDFSQALVP